MSRIFIVEDELHLATGLQFNLEAEGHEARVFDNAESAHMALTAEPSAADLIVLDVMLPGRDGFWLVSELRANQNYVPVLMLTARGRPEDVVKGFSSGADDYLAKPFELTILLARITGLLRRTEWMRTLATVSPATVTPTNPAPDVFTFGNRTIDFGALELMEGKSKTQLTVMEAELLRYLIRNDGRPVSRKQILEEVWNLHEDTDTRAIDNFIVRLRRYIEDDASRPRHLLTVRGVGYKFLSHPE